jgi:hypothetical protein
LDRLAAKKSRRGYQGKWAARRRILTETPIANSSLSSILPTHLYLGKYGGGGVTAAIGTWLLHRSLSMNFILISRYALHYTGSYEKYEARDMYCRSWRGLRYQLD